LLLNIRILVVVDNKVVVVVVVVCIHMMVLSIRKAF
jgi:hypothetical protein